MDNKPRVSDTSVPDIETCPRCGNNILIGDDICSRCGYNVASPTERFRQQPPNVIAFGGFALGVMFALAATGMDNPLQAIMLFFAFASIAGGGVYYAMHLLLVDDKRERKK